MEIAVNTMTAKDGTEILEIHTQNKVYRMNSLYRPSVEAAKFAEQYTDMEEDSVLVVFGYGNGLFPKAIMQICSERTKVIFYEPVDAVLDHVGAEEEKIDKILGKQGYLVAPRQLRSEKQYILISEFPRLLEELIQYSNYKNVQYTALPKYREIFPEQYEQFVDRIHYRIRRIQSNAATAKARGHVAVVNNIKNLRYVPDSYCVDSFLGVFPQNMPAIIVSAGPSLEKNIRILRQAKGQALILCVDSAVKYLLREDIIPDLLVSVDPLKSLMRFDDKRIDGIPIVGSTDMNYRVLENLPNSKVVFSSTENSYVQSLYQKTGHTIPQLKSGGSVATFAFSLCVYWGFQCVILVGQDLALTGNQQYAGAGKLNKESSGRELLEVEDIYGQTIHTYRDYYYYLKWFEQAVAMHSEIRVIDATEGGAKIAGTEIMTLQEALTEQAEIEFDMKVCLEEKDSAFSKEQKEVVYSRMRDSEKTLHRLKKELEAGIKLSQDGLLLAEQGVDVLQAYLPIDKQIQEICEWYNSLDETFFIQREIDASNLETFMKLFEKKEPSSLKEKYQRLQEYFTILLEAATAVSEIWDTLNKGRYYHSD